MQSNKRFLLLISGGLDSICLLEVFCLLRDRSPNPAWKLSALHVNYALRGAESDRDEAFVREFCQARAVPLFVESGATLFKPNANRQAQARQFRYTAAQRLAKQHNCAFFLTAHHLEDRFENFFLRLFNAASPTALVGMRLRRAKLVRPFFHTARAELQQFARQRQLSYVQDSSNLLSGNYLRNHFRNKVLPVLEQFASNWRPRLKHAMDFIEQQEESLQFLFAENGYAQLCGEWIILGKAFFALPFHLKMSGLHFLLRKAYPSHRFSRPELLALEKKLAAGTAGKQLFELKLNDGNAPEVTNPRKPRKVFYSQGVIGPQFRGSSRFLPLLKTRVRLTTAKPAKHSEGLFFQAEEKTAVLNKKAVLLSFVSPVPLKAIWWMDLNAAQAEARLAKPLKKQLGKMKLPQQLRRAARFVFTAEAALGANYSPLLAFIFMPCESDAAEQAALKSWKYFYRNNKASGISSKETNQERISKAFFAKTPASFSYHLCLQST